MQFTAYNLKLHVFYEIVFIVFFGFSLVVDRKKGTNIKDRAGKILSFCSCQQNQMKTPKPTMCSSVTQYFLTSQSPLVPRKDVKFFF